LCEEEEVEESLRLVGVEGCAPNLLSVSRVFFLAYITHISSDE
jgi:hypothetical protein